MEGVSNPGERFQNDAVSVAGFTGFMWTKGSFVQKTMGFQKYPDSCGSHVYTNPDTLKPHT